jgi:hypothetical protein
MTRIQIRLSDELHKRVKRFGAERNISLAEMARRGLEILLDRHRLKTPSEPWQLPKIRSGLRLPLKRLREIATNEEASRGLPHK